jgi:S-formylglutathione hydrolase FrmB
MLTIHSLWSILAVAAIVLFATQGSTERTSAQTPSPRVQVLSTKSYMTGALTELQVQSPEVDYPMRSIYTWTPSLNNADPQSLPVVYFLHGWPGSPSSMIAGVVPTLVKEFSQGVKPFIAVFPDGNAKTHIDSEWADSSDGKAMIESWLTTNAITAVEGARIRDRSERAIVGFSMGGYGAAIIALHHPELYSQVVTLAGYFLVDDLTGAFKGSTKIAYQSPSNYLANAKNLRWFMAEAKDDFTTPIRGEMAIWSKKLAALKIPVVTSAPAGGHSFVFVASETLLYPRWFTWPQVQTPTAVPSAIASLSPSATATSATTPSGAPSTTP